MPVAAKLARWLATVAVTVVLTVTLVTAIADRRMADLGPEHRLGLDQEFTAAAEQSTNWNDYLLIEAALSDELRQEIDADGTRFSQVDRYWSGGLTNPDNFDTNWNLSYQLDASPARGVALLLHGLSDSPYSMRATAETLQESGYNVVVPRMPGHGFAVGSLLDTRWEDWAAAVRVAQFEWAPEQRRADVGAHGLHEGQRAPVGADQDVLAVVQRQSVDLHAAGAAAAVVVGLQFVGGLLIAVERLHVGRVPVNDHRAVEMPCDDRLVAPPEVSSPLEFLGRLLPRG